MTTRPAGAFRPRERGWVGNHNITSVVAATHPAAAIIFSFVAWSSAVLRLGRMPTPAISGCLVAAMACGCVTIGLLNEVFDRDIDTSSKPWRAIPAGHIGACQASLLAIAVLILGLGLALLLAPASAVVLAVMVGVGVTYSAMLKRTPLSWVAYAIGYPLVPIWAWVSIGTFEARALTIFGYAAPFVVAVHLCNQLRDFDDDAAAGIGSVVQRLGKPLATTLCHLLLAAGPLPLIGAAVLSGSVSCVVVAILVTIVQWTLTVPSYFVWRKGVRSDVYNSLFRRIQVTGPLMLLIWTWTQSIGG